MTKAIVTGGAGFIGSALVRHLLAQPDSIVLNIDILTYAGRLETIADVYEAPSHQFLNADIADGSAMKDAFQRFQPDRVFHLAAESHVDRSIDCAMPFVKTNVTGTVTLLQAALEYWQSLPEDKKRNFRFLHVSTDEVFGSLSGEGAFDENTPYAPNSPYSASKAAADHFVRAWHRTYGLPAITTNCSNNFGPYQFPEKLIPVVILSALEGRNIPVYGTGKNVRDWLYVEDHVKALSAVADKGKVGEVYCIGGNSEISNIDLVTKICRLLDRRLDRSRNAPVEDMIEFVSDRPGHDLRYAIDAGKTTREIGWTPETDLDTGLEKTIDWYLDNREWWSGVAEANRKRLGLGNSG